MSRNETSTVIHPAHSSRLRGYTTLLLAGIALGGAFALGWTSRGGGTATPASPNAGQHTDAIGQSPRSKAPSARVAVQTSALRPREFSRERDQLRREFLIGEWLHGLSARDFAAAFAELRRLEQSANQLNLMTALLERWGAIEPAAAIAATNELGGSLGYPMAVLKGWVPRDAEAAFRWIEENPRVGAGGYTLFVPFMEALFASGRIDDAVAYFGRIPSEHSRFCAGLVARELCRRDPAAALQWFETVPDGRARQDALAAALAVTSETEPELATQFALADNNPETRNKNLLRVVSAWTQRDAPAALNWLNRQARGAESDALRSSLVSGAGAQRPELIEPLLAGFNDPRAREAAIGDLANRLAMHNPVAACDHVLRFASPQNSTNLLRNVVRTWERSDPTAARNFVAQDSRLSAEQRAALTKTLGPPPKS